MFTGIVRGRGVVRNILDRTNLRTLTILLPEGTEIGVETGASISVDGVCLTVTSLQEALVTFDVMSETLNRTTIGELKIGDEVNVERAARDGAEIGGHPLSGHIDCVCSVATIERPDNNVVMTFKVPQEFMRYIFSKGYIGLNGTSLTVSNVNKKEATFQVWFIPETLRLTTFGSKREADRINLEVERGTQVAVDTVRDFLEDRFKHLMPRIQGLLDEGI